MCQKKLGDQAWISSCLEKDQRRISSCLEEKLGDEAWILSCLKKKTWRPGMDFIMSRKKKKKRHGFYHVSRPGLKTRILSQIFSRQDQQFLVESSYLYNFFSHRKWMVSGQVCNKKAGTTDINYYRYYCYNEAHGSSVLNGSMLRRKAQTGRGENERPKRSARQLD